jgi:hypothetical protein
VSCIKNSQAAHTESKSIRKENTSMSKKRKNKVKTITEEEYEAYVRSLTGEEERSPQKAQ